MGLTSDQQRIKTLLTETITLLCKNGLHFQSEFSVEGLLGITVDQENVFLISIKETVRAASAVAKTQTVSKASTTAGVTGDLQCHKGDGPVRPQTQHHHLSIAAIDNRHASGDESSERTPTISNLLPVCKEFDGVVSKRLAGKKRHHSASRSSTCSDFSVEKDHSGQLVEGYDNSFPDVDTSSLSITQQVDLKLGVNNDSLLMILNCIHYQYVISRLLAGIIGLLCLPTAVLLLFA